MARMQQADSDVKYDTRLQLHNKTHKVTVKSTGQTFYGLVSRVDYDRRKFYLLEPDRPGMLGKDGKEFSWDDCVVLAEGEITGSFTDNMVLEWEQWDRKSGVGVR